jgi:hypothetical protein
MDNRINEIRRKISVLRDSMSEVETVMRDQVKRDLDCSEAALRLMAMRQELAALVDEWTAAGGGERLPTVQERLKGRTVGAATGAKPRRSARH